MQCGFERVEWGGAQRTMVLVTVTGGSASPTDSPLTLDPEQMGRRSEALLDSDLWLTQWKGREEGRGIRFCPFVACGELLASGNQTELGSEKLQV